jgi:hypothetical protein
MVQEGEREKQLSQEEIRTFGSSERGVVSLREKLLPAGVLLMVAGWIIFRVLLAFLALD